MAYEHPGIVFRPGPTGRRAALADGPDIWEIIAALNAIRDESPNLDMHALAAELATVIGLSATRVGVALRYYAAYPNEINKRIACNTETSDREERLWTVQQTSRDARA